MEEKSIYDLIYSGADLYKPPQERDSLLIELGQGCSWSGCAFCDFANDEYHIEPLEKLEERLFYLGQVAGDKDRLHFGGCNPLALGTDHLYLAFRLAQHYLPGVKEYSMYARAEDVLGKSRDELLAFKAMGLHTLHIGLESGSDKVLRLHNKGESVAQMLEAFRLLEELGLAYQLTIIPGLGGLDLSEEHCLATAKLLNQIHPDCVWAMALTIWEQTPLYDMVMKGEFRPMSYYQIALEERRMLQLMEMTSECLYVDSTLLKLYTVMGFLPRQKAELLAKFDRAIAGFDGPKEGYHDSFIREKGRHI
jgi:radical SAM superfamily enzyme YgiQ (UPF0313 family)